MFDKDNTGTINFSEFLLAIASSTQGDIDKRLGLAFDM
jgi:Ca2+-binding EF-hand superfamily protein